MRDVAFKVALRDDYRGLAEWLVQVSQVPEQHCLHTWSGESKEELRQRLLGYWDESEVCYVMAVRDGSLLGAMGAEYDEELERAWLHGPHVLMEDWKPAADELFRRVSAELPVRIRQMDAYLNVENVRGRRFYAERGFEEREHLNHEFWLVPGDHAVRSETGCVPLGRGHEASFKALYGALFPAAYYSPERVVNMIGQSHQVLVAAEGPEVRGFAVVSVDESLSSGEIQFLGVSHDFRGRGHGRRLLVSAVNWLSERAGVSRICLNVGEELAHARGLYESVGFKLQFTGIGLRKL